MKKNTVRAYMMVGMVFVVYTVIAFAVPFTKNTAFILSYLFSAVAIAVQVLVMKLAFSRGKDLKSRFYGFPVLRVGLIYLAVQLIFGLSVMTFSPVIPVWALLVAEIIILALALSGLIATDVMRDEIERQELRLKKDISAMRNLQMEAGTIAEQCVQPSLKKRLRTFAENLKYSDPVSCEASGQTENELANIVKEMQTAVLEEDYDGASLLAEKAEVVLSERNRICKMNKQ